MLQAAAEMIEIEGLLNFDACNYYYDPPRLPHLSFNQIFSLSRVPPR